MNYWNFPIASCDAPQEYNYEYEKAQESSPIHKNHLSLETPKDDSDVEAIKRAKKNGLQVSKRGRIIKKARWLMKDDVF